MGRVPQTPTLINAHDGRDGAARDADRLSRTYTPVQPIRRGRGDHQELALSAVAAGIGTEAWPISGSSFEEM